MLFGFELLAAGHAVISCLFVARDVMSCFHAPRLARLGRPSVFRRFSVSTSIFSSNETEPAVPSAVEDTSA